MRSLHLDFPFLIPNQAQKEITVNTALEKIDAILNTGIKAIQSSAPSNPSEGDVYIISAPIFSSEWFNQENNIAYYSNAQWNFIIPQEGMSVFVIFDRSFYAYINSSWTSIGTETGGATGTGSAVNSINASFNSVIVDRTRIDAVVNTQSANNNAEDLILNGTLVSNGIAIFDVPNKINFLLNGTDFDFIDYTIYGTDRDNNAITETVRINGRRVFSTNNYFSSITRIEISSFAGDIFGTIRVGTGDKWLSINNNNTVIHLAANVIIDINLINNASFEIMIIQNRGGGENITWNNNILIFEENSQLNVADDGYTLYKFINNGTNLLGIKTKEGTINIPEII